MSWSVDDIFSFLKYQIRKNQAGGFRSSDLFYAWNSEQSSYQSDLLGRWQRASNTKEGSNTGLIENETIMTKLACVTQTVTLTVLTGNATKPTDFIYSLALRINNAKVFQVDHDSIWSVLQDVIDPPSIANNTYYYSEYQNYYALLPATVTSLQLDYIQVAPDINWAFTYDGAGRQVYDPGPSSIQPVWGQGSIVEITKRCLNTLGISFKDQDFEQFGDKTIQTGNG